MVLKMRSAGGAVFFIRFVAFVFITECLSRILTLCECSSLLLNPPCVLFSVVVWNDGKDGGSDSRSITNVQIPHQKCHTHYRFNNNIEEILQIVGISSGLLSGTHLWLTVHGCGFPNILS